MGPGRGAAPDCGLVLSLARLYGPGGYETALDSYVWERGSGLKLLTTETLHGFSSMITRTGEVCRFAADGRWWALVSGAMSGASGRVLTGAAALFEAGTGAPKKVWSTPESVRKVRAHAHAADVWREVEWTGNSGTALEIFQVDARARAFRRIVRQVVEVMGEVEERRRELERALRANLPRVFRQAAGGESPT